MDKKCLDISVCLSETYRTSRAFSEELPYRLIQLYTFVGDVVLDPFCGSGTTCLSALKSERHYIGYDIEEKYVKLANERIREYTDQIRLPI